MFVCIDKFYLYICIVTNKYTNMIEENKSLRSRMLELGPGKQMMVCAAKRSTLQNYASVIKEETGRTLRVTKTNSPGCYIVTRHV